MGGFAATMFIILGTFNLVDGIFIEEQLVVGDLVL